jgi:hypothetical protein
MPKAPNLTGMSVDALLKLRAEIEKTLSGRAAQLRKELSKLSGAVEAVEAHSRAGRLRSNIEIGRGTPGLAGEQRLGGCGQS